MYLLDSTSLRAANSNSITHGNRPVSNFPVMRLDNMLDILSKSMGLSVVG